MSGGPRQAVPSGRVPEADRVRRNGGGHAVAFLIVAAIACGACAIAVAMVGLDATRDGAGAEMRPVLGAALVAGVLAVVISIAALSVWVDRECRSG